MRAGLIAGAFIGVAVILCSPQYFGQQISVTGRVEVFKIGGTQKTNPTGTVVWLRLWQNGTAAPSRKQQHQLIQKTKTFSPHVLVIPVGSVVDFPNRDPFFHNVFSLFEGKRFDLGLYEAGTTRSVLFNRPGISYIFCNIHPEMSAVVVALDTPYYGVADHRGSIAIPGVPPGRYEMRVWHERVLSETLEGLTRSIVVSETSTSFGVLQLTEQRALPQKHQNKYGRDYDISTPSVPLYVQP